MNKRKSMYLIMSISLFCMILLSGCGKKTVVESEPLLVKTQQISLGTMAGSAEYPGEVKGRYESKLSFQVGGKIKVRHVELGSRVHAGDILLEIDSKDLAQTVNSGAAQVASAQAQLNLAESNMNRYAKLYEQQAVSAAVYDQYKTSYEAALAAVQQAQAQYAQGSNSLSYSQLIADSDGVISALNVEAGQVVAAGQQVATLVKSGEMEVEINIPENRLTEISQAQNIQVSFWALNNIAVKGKVREIAPMADAVARTYKVRISIINPPEQLQLGMTANVTIGGDDNLVKATAIPLSAVYQTGDQPQVWVVQDGIVHLKEIKIEAFGDNQVKVTSGLSQGDIIVTAGVHKLREGDKVRLMAGESK